MFGFLWGVEQSISCHDIPSVLSTVAVLGSPVEGPDSNVICASFALSTGSLMGGFNAAIDVPARGKKHASCFGNNVSFLSLWPPA